MADPAATASAADALAAHAERETVIKRNPHPDFKAVEQSRPSFDASASFRFTKAPAPDWQWGQGGNDGGASLEHEHVQIDPHEAGRAPVNNYKLLISSIVPRPIAYVSSRAADGSSSNLAPFSYFSVICHDPPLFTLGIAPGTAQAKDTMANLAGSKECVVNLISEHYIEAANASSVNAPYGVSEWALSGLHQAPSTHVKAARVKEAIFAVECRVRDIINYGSWATPGKKSTTLVVLEGVNFWVRDDAINEDKNLVDPSVLRPVSRLGGIMYGRTVDAFELQRPDFSAVEAAENAEELLKKAAQP